MIAATGLVDGLHTPQDLAKQAQLHYVSGEMAGIRRRRAGRGFVYLSPEGRVVKDKPSLERFRKLGIPPAWTNVWICPRPDGHLQATGYDAKGRKQYRYHEQWHHTSNCTKFERLLHFGRMLPKIRWQVELDLGQPALSREKVVATVVRLLDETLMRVGNEAYVRENQSFGIATLRDEHVEIDGATVRFQFRGKAGKFHTVGLEDRRLAKIVQHCQDIPGQELFQYRNGDGDYHPLDSADVNEYLQELTGQPFTAKDFRTWKGTALATERFAKALSATTNSKRRRVVSETIGEVAAALGNTVVICKKYYVHPGLIELYLEGRFSEACADFKPRRKRWLSDYEQMLLHILSRLNRRPRRRATVAS
jgi:DNA topoisomerase-1